MLRVLIESGVTVISFFRNLRERITLRRNIQNLAALDLPRGNAKPLELSREARLRKAAKQEPIPNWNNKTKQW